MKPLKAIIWFVLLAIAAMGAVVAGPSSSIDGRQMIGDTEYTNNTTAAYGPDAVVIDDCDREQEVNNWRGVAIRVVKTIDAGAKARIQAPIVRAKCLHVYTGVFNEYTDLILEQPRISGCIKGIESHASNLKTFGGHIYGADVGVDLWKYAELNGTDFSDCRVCCQVRESGTRITGGLSQHALEYHVYADAQVSIANLTIAMTAARPDFPNPVGIELTAKANWSNDVAGVTNVGIGGVGEVLGADHCTIQRKAICVGGSTAFKIAKPVNNNKVDLDVCGVDKPAIVEIKALGTGNKITIDGNVIVYLPKYFHESNKITVNDEQRLSSK